MALIDIDKYKHIREDLKVYGLTTDMHLAHFLAQIHHESAGLTRLVESMNYTPQGLMSTFGTQRITKPQANNLGRISGRPARQQEIANVVYGGIWGRTYLGNIHPNDGWTYRGRGPLQCTGRRNYEIFGRHMGLRLDLYPEKMEDIRLGLIFAGWYWMERGITKYSGLHWNKKSPNGENIGTVITRLINGGTNGLYDRYQLFLRYSQPD